jgi:hypothetical protein
MLTLSLGLVMRELINSITDWRPIDPPERIKRLRKANRVVSRFIIGDRIAPIDLYVYLKARFGMPNGIQTILRAPHSDNLFHWQYAVGTDLVCSNQPRLIYTWRRLLRALAM